jgi:hypothetical protein
VIVRDHDAGFLWEEADRLIAELQGTLGLLEIVWADLRRTRLSIQNAKLL